MTTFLTLLVFPGILWLGASAAVAGDTVSVYQLTGAIQCIEGTGTPPDKAADLLRGQGVKVVSADRRKLPQEVGASCGAPADEANVIEVAAADWSNFVSQNPDAGGYGLWVFDEDTVQVYKYDGTLQCGMGREIPLEQMANELAAADIRVEASSKGTDGLVHISVCGASTGAINIFVIDRGSLPAAQRLGYRLLVTREMTNRIKFMPTESQQGERVAQSQSSPPAEPSQTGPVPLLW